MRSVDRKFYESKEWRQISKDYMESVNHLCERCLSKGLITPAKIVHHKIHLTEENVSDTDISMNFKNLEALCIECHNTEHFGKRKQRRYIVGEDGSIFFTEEIPKE